MITEDYVSFKLAKLLKEKGFDGECSFAFYKDGTIVGRYDSEFSYNYYDRPTLQMTMKWLREEHNIDIVIGKAGPKVYTALVIDNNDKDNPYHPFEDGIKRGTYYEFVSYEEACDEAIKYCLENLI